MFRELRGEKTGSSKEMCITIMNEKIYLKTHISKTIVRTKKTNIFYRKVP